MLSGLLRVRQLGGLPRERVAKAVGERSLKGKGEGCGEGFCRQSGSSRGRQRAQWDQLSCLAAGSNAQDAGTHLAWAGGSLLRPPYAGVSGRAHHHVIPCSSDNSRGVVLNVGVTNLHCSVAALAFVPQPFPAPCSARQGRSSPAQPGHMGRPCHCQVGQSAPFPREAAEPVAGASAAWAGAPGRQVAQGCSCP